MQHRSLEFVVKTSSIQRIDIPAGTEPFGVEAPGGKTNVQLLVVSQIMFLRANFQPLRNQSHVGKVSPETVLSVDIFLHKVGCLPFGLQIVGMIPEFDVKA